METQEAIKAMTSATADSETVKRASRKLSNVMRRRNHNLRVIASLWANGYESVAQQYASEVGIDMPSDAATDRILVKYGNAQQRREATERLRQRLERLENSEAWKAINRRKDSA